ncbi:hypothetical protein BD311DRAFT_777231 [Dichomitus squalens]|uniref:Uncharacterized protein n=1 Tax=Dichomitus squalens TaxID=114155 RepID=A0A4Q9MT72_9APHY|nr:hypothetical protein BD311DRAFT_777231 [Dichomitus squalens]
MRRDPRATLQLLLAHAQPALLGLGCPRSHSRSPPSVTHPPRTPPTRLLSPGMPSATPPAAYHVADTASIPLISLRPVPHAVPLSSRRIFRALQTHRDVAHGLEAGQAVARPLIQSRSPFSRLYAPIEPQSPWPPLCHATPRVPRHRPRAASEGRTLDMGMATAVDAPGGGLWRGGLRTCCPVVSKRAPSSAYGAGGGRAVAGILCVSFFGPNSRVRWISKVASGDPIAIVDGRVRDGWAKDDARSSPRCDALVGFSTTFALLSSARPGALQSRASDYAAVARLRKRSCPRT